MAFEPTEGQPFDPAVSPLSDPLSNPKAGVTNEGTSTNQPGPDTSEDEDDQGKAKEKGEPPADELAGDEDDLDDDDGEEDLAKKQIPYNRFKKINEERKQLAQQLAENKLAAEAWNEWKNHPQFFDVMSKVMAAAGKQDQQDDEIDLSTLDVSKMSDGEIFETAAKLGFKRAQKHYEPKIQMLEQRLVRIEEGQQSTHEAKFFADKDNFPYADRFKADIKNTAKARGVTYEEAYYIVTGPKLVRYGKDLGIKQTLDKGKSPHITGRQSKTAPREGRIYKSIAEAYNEAKSELGM